MTDTTPYRPEGRRKSDVRQTPEKRDTRIPMEQDMENGAMTERLGRFGHHPDPAIDFCIEVEELEAISETARLGLIGNGHEWDREKLDDRIQRAMEFSVGGDEWAIKAKDALRTLADVRGWDVTGEQAYAGQPLRRKAAAS